MTDQKSSLQDWLNQSMGYNNFIIHGPNKAIPAVHYIRELAVDLMETNKGKFIAK